MEYSTIEIKPYDEWIREYDLEIEAGENTKTCTDCGRVIGQFEIVGNLCFPCLKNQLKRTLSNIWGT
jgi:hypothetical protein